MKPIRLLALIHGLAPHGAEHMLVRLVNALPRNDIETVVAALSGDNPLSSQIDRDGASFHAMPRRWRYDVSPAFRLGRLMRETRTNVALVFGLYEYFFFRLGEPLRRPRVPAIISLHSTLPRNYKERLQRFAYIRLLRKTDQFVTVCDAQAEHWIATYGLPRERFQTVYNGVDVSHFTEGRLKVTRAELRERHRIPANSFVILKVAHLGPWKGHEVALAALADLTRMLPHCAPRLVIVGSGSAERLAALQRRTSELGLRDSVVFCGAQEDVRPYYLMSDIFTLTSLAEAFSVAALEAMAMGLPCVLTRIGGAAEMVEEGVNGYLIRPGDPRDAAEGWARAFVQKGRLRSEAIRRTVVEKFTIERCAQQFANLLEAAVRARDIPMDAAAAKVSGD